MAVIIMIFSFFFLLPEKKSYGFPSKWISTKIIFHLFINITIKIKQKLFVTSFQTSPRHVLPSGPSTNPCGQSQRKLPWLLIHMPLLQIFGFISHSLISVFHKEKRKET